MPRTHWPGRDPSRADEQLVQLNIRVPFWYKQKLQAVNPKRTVAENILQVLAQEVPQERSR